MFRNIMQLKDGLEKGFIDKNHPYSGSFEPRLLMNDADRQEDVLHTILDELRSCDTFMMAVAFITESGLQVLKTAFYELAKKGVKGRILTSTYHYFNQPKVFSELLKFTHVEVKIAEVEGFHSKGYIFNHADYSSLIVGSSNLTASALQVNVEWNIKLTSHRHGSLIVHFLEQFEAMWTEAEPLSSDWISHYQTKFNQIPLQRVAEYPSVIYPNKVEAALTIEPNVMQRNALKGLREVRERQANRALVVSATGTGKTYLAAFDVRTFRPKRLLFVVHREQILKKAMMDFKQVLGGTEADFGLLAGGMKSPHSRYVFATVQTLSKKETLAQFDRTAFDYIIIDESHRAGSKTYQHIIDYFNPKFLLGMTATPERTDGYDLFRLFHHNIAYEIRLKEALASDLLVPFHYFGVTAMESTAGEVDDFREISLKQRVDHILEKVTYYGYAGKHCCGLMFCGNKKEAHELSHALNQEGLRTVALTGSDSQEKREREVSNLERGELDYILTVDIFNEGIDIPQINQVVLLRQTESAIIFVQQLGRGLRKHESKAFLTVIDFIGNHNNNYLIPVALYGDYSYKKDRLRKHIVTGSRNVPGQTTVHFEEIAKSRIFQAIDKKNMQMKKDLDDDYVRLKNKLGRPPMMMDFIKSESRDPVLYVHYSGSFYHYQKKIERFDATLTDKAAKTLSYLSKEVLNSIRLEEGLLLKMLMGNHAVTEMAVNQFFAMHHLQPVTDLNRQSILRNINLRFYQEQHQNKLVSVGEKYGIDVVTYDKEVATYTRTDVFTQLLRETLFTDYLQDQLAVHLYQYNQKRTKRKDIGGFILYEKYTRKDVFRILGFDSNPVAQNVGGYLVSPDQHHCPIFVNYHKEADISETTRYDDRFLSPNVLQWMSKNKRKITSNDVSAIYHYQEHQMRLPLFIKKHNDEGSAYYYMGDVEPDQNSFQEMTMSNKGKPVSVVQMNLMLKEPVERNMYHYIMDSTD